LARSSEGWREAPETPPIGEELRAAERVALQRLSVPFAKESPVPKEPTFENALSFAQDLIRIPSLSGSEEEVAKRIILEMEALGYDETRLDEVGNVIGVVRGVDGGPPVLLNCHMDVVAEGEPEAWEHPPFGGVVAEGFLHGRGAMDIKGPLALQTYAAAALRGWAPGDVIVAHTVFEERGGWGMEHLLTSGSVRPAAVIIGEATGGDVTMGHRGRGELEIVLSGVAGHASAPERARNALDLVPPVLRGLADLAESQGEDPILGRASLAPTQMDIFPESRNVIPDRVVVVVDWRVLPGSTDEELENRIREVLRLHIPHTPEGMGVEVRTAREWQETYTGVRELRNLFTPGFLMQVDHPAVVAAAEAVGRRDGGGPARVRPWTFATDGGWSCGVFGVPTVGFAPGEERFAHTNRERLGLDEARWAFARHSHLVPALQKALA
jgi:succinyl-diaminopimelate desuccinylase